MKQLLVLGTLLLAFVWQTPLYAAPMVVPLQSRELIVKLVSGLALDDVLNTVGDYDAENLGDSTYLVDVASDSTDDMLAARVAALPGVVYAQPNYERSLLRTTNDPLLGQQWHLGTIQAPTAWDTTIGEGVTVALLDTGVSASHPDLQGRISGGYDLFNDDGDPSDDEGHGTHTAGLVAANGDNAEGSVGVCWRCTVLPIKVLGARGRGNDATIAAGIRLAVDQGARVIGMSLGGPEESQILRDAVEYANSRNVLLVAASGNDGTRGTLLNYPAAYPSVLAVAASNQGDAVTAFSTTGDFVDLVAPGSGILSTYWSAARGNSYATASGTSAAAPLVAGAAALVFSVRPDLSAAQVAEILEASADDVDVPGRDPQTGWGRLNVGRAVQLATAPDVLSRSRIQGVVSGATLDQVVITLSTGQQTRPDANGAYSFESLPTGTYTVVATLPDGQQSSQQAYVSGTSISVANIELRFGAAPVGGAFDPVSAPTNGSVVYFPEVQHTLGGEFLTYWRANGGLPVFGYPISQEFTERGDDGREYTVQYFERNRFEFHPENAAPYNVQLGRLGDTILRQQGRDWFSFPKGSEQADCRFFAETGHSLCGAFLRHWSSQGLELDGRSGKTAAESLALFGLPISEPQIETSADGRSYLVQWFERARFEDHGPDGVLLGLLGRELARR